ncbi:MAG TPA: AI-2E family transporter [Gemmatimonadaceae bacterium]|nr:AI-2E family transporter [Gemmatimonadaceae bacterium]
MTLPPEHKASTPPMRPVSQSDLVRAALVVVATLVGLQLLWSARFLMLTAFLGVLFGINASAAVEWLRKHIPIKRTFAAPLVVFGAVAALGLFAFWSGPTLANQSQELRTKLPEAVGKVEDWLAEHQPALLNVIAPPDSVKKVDSTVTAPPVRAPGIEIEMQSRASGGRLFGAVASYTSRLKDLAFGVLQSTVAVMAGAVLVVFLALYIALDPDVYRRGVILLVPAWRRERVDQLLTALGTALRTWFATQLIAMLVIGTVTTVALLIIGVRAALPLGVLAGLFEFIPNIGPMLSAIPAVLMGFTDSPQTALTVGLVYWGIQLLENNLLIPYLMRQQLELPPALTLVTQVVMAYVFGFLGLFVAIPLLATVVVAVRILWLGEDPAGDEADEASALPTDMMEEA